MDQYHHQVSPNKSSISIIAFALAGLIYIGITSLIGAKFFMVFSPIFMAYASSYSAFLEWCCLPLNASLILS